MTRENIKEYWPHFEALRDGELQVKTADGNWTDWPNAVFTLPHDCYRRKPKPLERWFYAADHETAGWHCFFSEQALRERLVSGEISANWLGKPRRIIHMREVTK